MRARAAVVVAATAMLACSSGAAETSVRRGLGSRPSGQPVPLPSTVVVGGSPCGVAHGGDSVWVSDLAGDRVVKVDAQTRAILGTFPVGSSPCSLVALPDGIWVSPSEEGSVQVLDPTTGRVTETIPISDAPADAKLTVGFGAVWATSTPDRELIRIDPDTREVVTRIRVGTDPRSVVIGGGLVWVAVEGADRVVAVDPATNAVRRRFRAPEPSTILAPTKRLVWVGHLANERATVLRATDGSLKRSYDLPSNPQPGTIVSGQVWAPDHLNSELLTFPVGNGDLGRIEVGTYPSALVRVADLVWVAKLRGRNSLDRRRGFILTGRDRTSCRPGLQDIDPVGALRTE